LLICNNGTAPATDIDISINFPDGFSLSERDAVRQPPAEPKPPARPRTQSEILTDGLRAISYMPHSSLLTNMSTNLLKSHRAHSFSIKKNESYEISDHLPSLKHGFLYNLPMLFLTFDTFDSARSFECDYLLSVANLPKPVSGKLHFVINKESSS